MIHNVAKGVPHNMVINGERMSVKNIDLYKHVLEAESKKNAVIDGSLKRINNQGFDIRTKEQTKTFITCTITRNGHENTSVYQRIEDSRDTKCSPAFQLHLGQCLATAYLLFLIT